MRARLIISVRSLLVLAVGVGCAEGSGSPALKAITTPAPTAHAVLDSVPPPGINELVHTSVAGILGTVLNVGEPQWNSSDGQHFALEDEDNTGAIYPWRYREALVRVTQVLWTTDPSTVSLGHEVRVHIYGDGTPTGASAGAVRENQLSGPVESNTDILWILDRSPFYIKNPGGFETIQVLGIAANHDGNWTLNDGQAISAEPQRSVPAERLIARVLQERLRGRQPSDDRGRYDPLEE